MGIESGTCNVCSSPCKSCMHNNRTVFDMESKEECGSSCNTPLAKEDVSYSSTYSNKMSCYKKRSLDDLPFTGSEANNLLSSSSGHDLYSKNADSKVSVRSRATCEKVENADMSTVSLKEIELNQPLGKTSIATDFSHRIHLKQDEEVISCLTENKDSNVEVGHCSIGLNNKDSICSSVPNADIKNVVKVETTNCFPGSDIEESQSNCRRYIARPEDPLKECEDSVSSPFHAKPNLLLTHNGYDDCHKNDCKSSDNGLNCEVNNDGKSSLKTQAVEGKYHEGKTSAGPCLTDDNRLDKDVSFKAAMVSTAVNTKFEMPCLLDGSNVKESQQVIEGGSSGTEQELTDVNVCDICGDVGREYLLAICSNCGDGAEHIYCMRKMLRKVPEGDWLCEICQLKEQTEKKIVDNHKETTSTPGKCKLNVGPEITKTDNSKKVLEKPKECTRKKCPDTMKRDVCAEVPETSKVIKQKVSSMSHLRTMTKSYTKPKDPDRKKQICNLQSSNFSAKRRAEYQEILSPNSRPPDVSGRFVEMGSPRKKPYLLRDASSKNLDARKEGTACVSLSNGGQNTNKIPAISRSQSTLGSHLSKAPSPLQSPHRAFSRSSSFNINSASKVKPYVEDVPFKREVTGSSISEQRKNALPISKSTSFKSIENRTKRYVDPSSVLLHKKKENMENKCNPATNHLPASPKASAGIHISKKNLETTMSTVKSKHHLHDLKRQRLDKGSSDANDTRNKSSMKQSDDQRLSHSPKARSCLIPIKESVQSNSIIKVAESATCTEIPKAANFFNTPQIAVSDTSQSCSTDKLKSSSLEPCSEKNSADDGIKRNKWKDAAKKTILKAKSQNTSYNDGLDNRLAELPPTSIVVSHIVEISNEQHIATVLEDSPSTEVACILKDIRCTEIIDLNAIASASDDTTTQASQHANSHMTLAIPNFEYIWQGCFEVLSEVESAPYYGIQAHLSTSASPKVHEMTTKFPAEIMLEEVPWTNSWPMQFQGISPDENNIALFFFAKDIESYEKSYSKLLEKMLKNDLSLKGIIDGVELLIFPSTKLPIQSQRWNRLFFLWGVFKARRHYNDFIPKSGYQKEPLRPSSNFDPKTEDIPLTPKIEMSNCKLPSCSVSTACMDNVGPSTPKVEEISFTHKSQVSDQNPSILSGPYSKPLDDKRSSFLSSSDNPRLDYSNHANYYSGNNSHSSDKTFSLPESRFQMTNTPPCSELENGSSYLNFHDSNMRGKSEKTSAHLTSPNVQIWHSRELYSHPTSPGSDNIRNIPKDKEIPMTNEYNKEEFRSNTNHARSYTSNAVLQSNYLPLPSPTGNEILNLRSSSSTSNVHPLFSATVNAESDRTFTAADKDILFFPNATRNVVEILSSDDEDALNPNKPDLELVLWNKRNSELEQKWKMTDADDEESASLSLSLAIPASKKEQVKKEESLQENGNANAPLRLFGKSIGI